MSSWKILVDSPEKRALAYCGELNGDGHGGGCQRSGDQYGDGSTTGYVQGKLHYAWGAHKGYEPNGGVDWRAISGDGISSGEWK